MPAPEILRQRPHRVGETRLPRRAHPVGADRDDRRGNGRPADARARDDDRFVITAGACSLDAADHECAVHTLRGKPGSRQQCADGSIGCIGTAKRRRRKPLERPCREVACEEHLFAVDASC